MVEPISDDTLAAIRMSYSINPDRHMWETEDAIDAFGHVEILLAEVDRLRADNARLRALVADEHTRLSQELDNEAERVEMGRRTDKAEGERNVAIVENRRLRAERDEARAYADSLTGAVKGAADFTDAMRRIREVSATSAEVTVSIASAIAAMGVGRTDAAELPQ